jgi:hypothetical protein
MNSLNEAASDRQPGGLQRCRLQPIDPACCPFAAGFAPHRADCTDQERFATGTESDLAHPSWMTVGTFVEEKFAPEHIGLLRYASRNFYQAILKHVIPPEEVDRIFRKNPSDPRKTLRALAGWPYLNDVRLSELCPDDIARLINAAVNRGYSVETVRHIRSGRS